MGPEIVQIAHQEDIAMDRLDFTPYRRSTVGFDRVFDFLERPARATAGDHYHQFQLPRPGVDSYRHPLALAGFNAHPFSKNTRFFPPNETTGVLTYSDCNYIK